jgi:hypothetical protein
LTRERERVDFVTLFFGEKNSTAPKKNRENREGEKTKEALFSFFTKKNSVHSLTMADVQHERGYQKQVGVNVG